MRKLDLLFIVLLFLSCLCIGGCEEEVEPQGTYVYGDFGDPLPARKSAVVKGTFGGDIVGVSEFGFLYSRAEKLDPTDQTTKIVPINEAFSVGKEYALTLTGLDAGVEYFYCMYVKKGNMTRKTEPSKFTTLKIAKPLLDKMELVKAEEYAITLSCSVQDNGGANITQCGFYYKKEGDPKFEPKVASLESFMATIDKLSPGVRYEVFPYAINSEGLASGDTIQFSTEGFEAPVVKTFASTSDMYGSDWALLKGSVEKDGASALKEMGFCYTTDNKEPTVADNRILVTDKNKFEHKLTNLKPATTYYVRAFARNETKVGYGERIEFTTRTFIVPTCELPEEATEITDVSFNIKAAVQMGTGVITSMGFCYSAVGIPTINDSKVVVDQVEQGFLSATISGLKPDVSYEVRGFITSGDQTIYSKSRTVRTGFDPVPAISNVSVSGIKATLFNVQADIKSNVSIKKQLLLYSSTNKNPKRGGNDVQEVDFYNGILVEKLTPKTTYYISIYVLNEADKEAYSEVKTVKTQAVALPQIQNVNISRNNLMADISATYTSDGKIEECGICYSTTNKIPTVDDTKVVGTESWGSNINGEITDLKPGTTYYIRVYAKCEEGIGYSEAKELVVTIPVPVVRDLNITQTGFTANVSANHTSELTMEECGICYSTTNKVPTMEDTKVVSESTWISVQIKDLKPATTYYIRAYAKSKAGVGYSEVGKLTLPSNVPDEDDNVSPDK